jgi:hypothetical protein
MQCREFEERMHLLLDERQAPQKDPQLHSHAQSCANCRQLLLDQEALFRGLDCFRTPSLRHGFPEQVVSQAAGAAALLGRPEKRRPWLLAAAVVSTAAVALIALSIAMNRAPNDRSAPANRVPANHQAKRPGKSAANQVGSHVPRATTDNPPDRSPMGESRAAPGSNSPLAAADVESLEQYGQALQSLAAQVPQAVDRFDEVEQATPGLRPVRTSFTLAIGTIRRTIPPPRKQEQRRPGKRDSGLIWSPATLVG